MKKTMSKQKQKTKSVFYLRTLHCLPLSPLGDPFRLSDYIGNAVCLVQFADRAWVYAPWPQKQPPTLKVRKVICVDGMVGGRVRVTCLLCSSALLFEPRLRLWHSGIERTKCTFAEGRSPRCGG